MNWFKVKWSSCNAINVLWVLEKTSGRCLISIWEDAWKKSLRIIMRSSTASSSIVCILFVFYFWNYFEGREICLLSTSVNLFPFPLYCSKIQQVLESSKFCCLSKKCAIRLLFSTQNNSITFFVCGEKISFWQKDWFWGNFRRIMQVSVFFSWEIIQSVLKRKNLFVRKEERFTNTEATLRLFCKFFPLKRKSCSNSFCFFNSSFLLFFNRIVN